MSRICVGPPTKSYLGNEQLSLIWRRKPNPEPSVADDGRQSVDAFVDLITTPSQYIVRDIERDGSISALDPAAHNMPIDPNGWSGVSVSVKDPFGYRIRQVPRTLLPTHRGGIQPRKERDPRVFCAQCNVISIYPALVSRFERRQLCSRVSESLASLRSCPSGPPAKIQFCAGPESAKPPMY